MANAQFINKLFFACNGNENIFFFISISADIYIQYMFSARQKQQYLKIDMHNASQTYGDGDQLRLLRIVLNRF